MLVANRRQLVQATNSRMVDFRRQEVEYFVSIYANFGYQCAFIAGFVLNAVAQVPVNEPEITIPFFKYLYCISSAVAFVFSTNVIFCSGFIMVFGQGLAIRGPIGSLSIAIDGMLAEREQTIKCFTISLLFFGLQIIGIYWIQMNNRAATVSSIFSCIGFVVWYKYALRIYNRFDFTTASLESKNRMNLNSDNGLSADYITRDSLAAPLVRSLNTVQERYKQEEEAKQEVVKSKGRSFFSKLLEKKERESMHVPKIAGHKKPYDMIMYDSMVSFKISARSFAQMQEDNEESQNTVTGEIRRGKFVWFRCYAVINDNLIYLYKDKTSFLNGTKPLRKRALDIEGFQLDQGHGLASENSSYHSGNDNDNDNINHNSNESENAKDKTLRTPSNGAWGGEMSGQDSDSEDVGYAIRVIPQDLEDDRYSLCFKYDNVKERDAWLRILREYFQKDAQEER